MLVAGAQRGIGLACARALSEAGAAVALADLPGSTVGAAAARLGHGATGHEFDVADAGSVERLVAEVVGLHGRLDAVVNAAAVLAPEPFLDLTTEAWDRTLAVNARGTVLLAQAAARQFVLQGGGGRIVAFASILSRTARLNNVAYAASKAAVVQAVRCMALELGEHRITVNAISPGSTSTEMLVEIQAGGDPRVLEAVVRGDASAWRLGVPLGRLAAPEDQAALAVFLVSDAAGHITGQEIAVDGGQSVV